ncbi:MAG: hypothetical protein M3362_09940 [Acidobacteriota bacterium]|nr:hypothetical protein [Acidobacteriota bacterium]
MTHLRVALVLLFVCSLHAYGGTEQRALKEREIKKGADIIEKLRRIEQLTDGAPDFESYKKLIDKLYPDLFVKAADLGEGDLKTDLTTAVFLYDEALRGFHNSDRSETLCIDETRAVYAKLCADPRNDTAAKLLWARARLHTRWAAALIDYNRGVKDAATIRTLDEMDRERSFDLALAEKAVAALRTLEQEVCAYPSLAELEEKRALATVSFERLSKDADDAILKVDLILRDLPRGALFYSLYLARNSYSDGLFWWRKSYRRKEMVVNVNNFNSRDELKTLNLDAGTVNYTVTINWRKAISHTHHAMSIIEALRSARNEI